MHFKMCETHKTCSKLDATGSLFYQSVNSLTYNEQNLCVYCVLQPGVKIKLYVCTERWQHRCWNELQVFQFWREVHYTRYKLVREHSIRRYIPSVPYLQRIVWKFHNIYLRLSQLSDQQVVWYIFSLHVEMIPILTILEYLYLWLG